MASKEMIKEIQVTGKDAQDKNELRMRKETNQKQNVAPESAMIQKANGPAIRSASRWTGASRPCASSTCTLKRKFNLLPNFPNL